MGSRTVRSTTVLLATVALLAAAAAPLAAQTRPIYIRPGAPGEPSRQLTQQEIRDLVPGGPAAPTFPYTEADVAFMQDMILHHGQALLTSGWAIEGRGSSEQVHTTARRINFSQSVEIGQMEQWLRVRGETVPDPEDHHDHHMPGMATQEELDELEALEGQAFDVRFLELMIRHHRGAITMVRELREAGGGFEPNISALASTIEQDQRAEIGRMELLLTRIGD